MFAHPLATDPPMDQPPRLLIVDDDPFIRHLMRDLFAEGYQVTIGSGGGEALEFLAQQRDPMTLTAFVPDGLRQGYEASLQKHYGWNLDELQMRWQQQVLGEGRGAQSAQK